jgi:hypothetical protein
MLKSHVHGPDDIDHRLRIKTSESIIIIMPVGFMIVDNGNLVVYLGDKLTGYLDDCDRL